MVKWFILFVLVPKWLFQVMLDHQGLSKGSGFVAFATPEEASRAVSSFFFLKKKNLSLFLICSHCYVLILHY